MSVEEDYQEPLPDARPAPTNGPRVSAFTGNAMILLGVTAVAGGAALAASSYLPWAVQRLAQQVASYGIGFDVVAASGVVLCAAGVVGRSVARLSRQLQRVSDDHVDTTLAVEQLNSEVVEARSGIDQLLTQPEEESLAEDVAAGNEKDALYRMAASLDQLGARLSKRIATEVGTMKAGHGELVERVGKVADRLAELERATAAATSAAKSAAAAAAAAAAKPAAPVAAAPAPKPQAQPQPAPRPQAAPQAQAEAPAPAPAAPMPAAAPAAEKAVAPKPEEDDAVMIDLDAEESPLGLFDRLAEEVEGPNRQKSDIEVDIYDPPPALPGAPQQQQAQEDPAEPKTYQSSLDRLMPDDRVRDALDESR